MNEPGNKPDDEALSAYLDGELPRDEADSLRERLAGDPALARRLEDMRAADAAARQAYQAVDELPLPQGVLDLLRSEEPARARHDESADNVVALPLRTLRRFVQMPVAIAASLALAAGFFVSEQMREGAVPDSRLYASAIPAGSDLQRLLESGTGGEAQTFDGGATGQLLLTFQDAAGEYCRQLHVYAGSDSMQAVACRRGDQWRMEVASFATAAQMNPDGPYRAATSGTPAAVEAAVDGLIGDREPLDAGAERRLVDSGWKKERPSME